MKLKRISADEAIAKRKDHTRETAGGIAIVKAARAPASWDATTRSARFIMTTEQVDRYGDVVITAGIDTTEFEKNPVAPLMHNSRSWPVGGWANLEKVLKGRPRRMEGDLVLLPAGGPVKVIEETEWMLANNGIRACSIGFLPDWDEVEGITNDEGFWTGLQFNKSSLLECSPCVIPANPGALAKSADGDPRLARELLEEVLDNWAKTPEGLLMPRKDYEQAYRTTTEKISTPTTPPATDEEIAAAEIRSIEFEVAKTVVPVDGKTVAVVGPANAKLLGEGGKWKHVGHVSDGGKADIVVLSTVVDDKTVYSRLSPEHDAGFEIADGKPVPIKAAPSVDEPAAEETVVVSLKAKLDTTEAEASITNLSGLLDGLKEKIAQIFTKAEPLERVEPTLDVPAPAPPAAEAVAAARTKAAETLARLTAAGAI